MQNKATSRSSFRAILTPKLEQNQRRALGPHLLGLSDLPERLTPTTGVGATIKVSNIWAASWEP